MLQPADNAWRFDLKTEKKTVFIVDDDLSVRRGLARLVKSADYDVEVFDSAKAFLAREPFDGNGCLVLDVKMPDMNGFDLLKVLRNSDYCMPVIFISGHGDIPMSVQAMKEGAVTFLAKPFDGEDFLAVIRSALENDRRARTEYEHALSARAIVNKLTTRERQVMTCVIAGMLNKQIGAELGISENTVKIHRGRIMAKSGLESLADLISLANKAGVVPYRKINP